MKYRVDYNWTGPEDSGFGSNKFDSDSDSDAKREALNFIDKLRRRIIVYIPNPFWRPEVEMTGLFRIQQEEIVEQVVV